ncbi:MAG: DUF4842 domain-containing protein [Duncaniella sp.]|nr:DUF4842 domain-containing protein [Duncaniella sp.]
MPFALVLAGFGLVVASCTTDEITIPKSELYTREFIKQFGVFDPNHDWNHAQRANVTVTTSTSTDIKIYAKVNGTRYLFGTYLGVNGSRELGVDIPKGVTSLILRANGRDYTVSPGSKVNIGGSSRLITDPGSTADNKLTWSISRERMLSTEAMKQYIEDYPEDKPNLGRGTTSFYFVADGEEHTFYPFYWNTAATHALGIYYIPDESNPDNIVMQDLYFTKSGELASSQSLACNPTIPADFRYEPGDVHMFGDTRYKCSEWAEVFPGFRTTLEAYKDDEATEMQNYVLSDGSKFSDGIVRTYSDAETADFVTDNGYISRIEYRNYTFVITETVTKEYVTPKAFERRNFEPAHSGVGAAYENVDFICSRGITYKLEKGTKYGFYIKVSKEQKAFFDEIDGVQVPKAEQPYDFIIFSQASRNASYVDSKTKEGSSDDVNAVIRNYNWYDTNGDGNASTWWDESFTENDKHAYASWDVIEMGGKEYAMFGFEDWEANSNDKGPDLNDLMFLFETGTRPSNVVDEDEPEDELCYEWIVAAEDLGNTDDFDFNDVVFGVGNFKLSEDGETATVDVRALASGGTLPVYLYHNEVPVGGEFHSWFGDYPTSTVINATGTASAKGKTETITVNKDFTMACCQLVDGTPNNMGGFTIHVIGKDGTEITEITAPNLSTNEENFAPQMICVPTHWLWPTERTHILNPYPNFKQWVENQGSCTDWHENPQGGVIVRTDIPANTTKPDGGWGK